MQDSFYTIVSVTVYMIHTTECAYIVNKFE